MPLPCFLPFPLQQSEWQTHFLNSAIFKSNCTKKLKIKCPRAIQVKWTLGWQSMLSGKKQLLPFIFYCRPLSETCPTDCLPISPASHKLFATLVLFLKSVLFISMGFLQIYHEKLFLINSSCTLTQVDSQGKVVERILHLTILFNNLHWGDASKFKISPLVVI